MTSLKNLQAVAHDIAHHAQSGLSWLHPHFGRACREASVLETSIDLLVQHPYPAGLPSHEPLALALTGLHQRFLDMLSRYHLREADVESAELHFAFKPDPRDDYSCLVRSVLRSGAGRTYEQVMP
jgi:hypothetical protein